MAPNDFFEALASGFPWFERIMNSLPCPEGLSCETLLLDRLGRRLYLGNFGKKSWTPTEMWEEGPRSRLDPATCFRILIAMEYSVLRERFRVYLHYGTNPWHPQVWLKEHLHRADYEAYLRRRGLFIDTLRPRAPKELRFTRYPLQIGRWTPVPIRGATVEAAKGQLSQAITKLALAVDGTLDALNVAGAVSVKEMQSVVHTHGRQRQAP